MGARVRAFGGQSLEDEVPDEVRRREGRTPRVQRLEDLLRVLVGRQVDRDELQSAGEHDGQRLRPFGGALVGRVQPLGHLLGEVLVRADNSRRGVTERLVLDGRLGVHHLVEGVAVLVAVPELEPRVLLAGT